MPAAASRRTGPVLALLTVAVFAGVTTEVLPVGLLPAISADLGVSRSRVGLLVSVFALVVAVGAIPLAAVAARQPKRVVLAVLLLGYAVSNTLLATTSSYWVAFVARLLGGLSHAGFFSVAFAVVAAVAPPGRVGRSMAIVSSGVALAFTAGVPLGTALGTAVGWRWSFAIMAVLMVLLAAAALAIVPGAAADDGQPPVLRAVRGRLLVVGAGVVLITLGHNTLYTYVSPLLLGAGVARNHLGVALIGYGVAGAVGLLIAGIVADRHPRLAMTATATLITACLFALAATQSSTAATVALVCVWGVGVGALPTLAQTLALLADPAAHDAAPAVVNSAFNIGIGVGAFVGAQELYRSGPPVLAVTGGVIAAAAVVVFATTARAARATRPG